MSAPASMRRRHWRPTWWRGYSTGNDVVHQPSKVRARRPSVGQTRLRATPDKAKAAAAQLPLFDASALRACWQLGLGPGQTPPCADLDTAQVSQIGTDFPSATPTSAPLMQLLRKPATAYEREQQIEALINDPRMQGQLRRGRGHMRR